MHSTEERIEELHYGLGSLVQALTFLQNFLESDYGLKYQFHAYCSNNVNSGTGQVLETLKRKFPHTFQLQPEYQERSLYGQLPEQDGKTQKEDEHFSDAGGREGHFLGGDHGEMSPSRSIVSVSNSDDENSFVMDENEELFTLRDLEGTEVNVDTSRAHESTIYTNREEDREEDNSPYNEDGRSPPATFSVPKTKKVKKKKGKTAEDNFKCPHCRRRCHDEESLEEHLTHHKKQFQCSECSIWLSDKSTLKRHMRSHLGLRPFKCSFCKEAFSRQDIYKKHVQRKHKDMLEFSNT